jgi:aldehyde:ferredoxin oxidoreductase
MDRYKGRLAIVDLATGTVDHSRIAQALSSAFIGGRGLGAAILCRHGANAEPLAPESPLCMLLGPMTGADFSVGQPPDLRLPLAADAHGWRGRTPAATSLPS